MKNKKMVLWIALFVTAIIPAFSQQYDSESDFQVQRKGNGIEITRYTGSKTMINIPPRIQNLPVTSIGDWAFRYCTGLTSVTIPGSVTNIADYAFSSCTGLSAINVGSGNTAYSSQEGVLYNKDKTTLICYPAGKTGASLTIPTSVTSIGVSAFSDCTALTAINVDAANITYSSQDGVLYNKNKTTLIKYPQGKTGSLTIPTSVITIGISAFWGCGNLTGITIPNNVTSIGSMAFAYCTSLKSITIPNNVTSI